MKKWVVYAYSYEERVHCANFGSYKEALDFCTERNWLIMIKDEVYRLNIVEKHEEIIVPDDLV